MIFQWVRYKADLQEGDTKVFSSWKETFFLAFMSPQLAAFFPLRSPFQSTLHKKSSWNKVSSLKNGAVKWAILPWTGSRFEGLGGPDASPQTSSVSPFPLPTPIPGADSSKFRQYRLLQGWQISLTGDIVSLIKQIFLFGLAIDWTLKRPRHMRLQKWAAKEPSFLREFAVYRIWTFERVWFSELVACVAEALLSPFSAPFLCRFHAFYEEWRIGVGPKKNIFFFSPFKRRERERARTWKISREQYDEMKAGSRLKMRFSVRFCVFCWPLLL